MKFSSNAQYANVGYRVFKRGYKIRNICGQKSTNGKKIIGFCELWIISDLKVMISKNLKKCAPEFVFFDEKKKSERVR